MAVRITNKRQIAAMTVGKKPRRPRQQTELTADREQDLYGDIIEFLHLHGIKAFRFNSGKVKTAHGTWVQLAPKGSADIIGIIGRPGRWFGRWICVEGKRSDTDKPTPDQQAWLDDMAKRGAVIVLARNTKEVEDTLRQLEII
jgi:hypothetical protein